MSEIIIPNRRQERRGTAADLAAVNEVLRPGEWCLETDTGKVKFGDGVTAWNALPYVGELANLGNPSGDRIVYWDDAAEQFAFIALGTGLAIGSGGDLDVTGGGGGGQAAIQFKDEGTNVGSSGAITAVDFVGSGISAAVAGTTLTVTASGGGGGAAAAVKWNHVDKGAGVALSSGILQASITGSGVWPGIRATKFLEGDGAWYWECEVVTGAANVMIGIAPADLNVGSDFAGQTANSYAYYASGGQKYNANAGAAYGASYTTGDIIGVAFKVVSGVGSLWFRKNGTWQNSGDPAAGTNAAFTAIPADAYFAVYSANQSSAVKLRALASAFSGGIPSGFVAYGA